jgi:glycosyltransferase involved in cell wall biosynthesis
MSPRGEFVEGPLNIKYKKKKTYILLSRIAGFYNDIKWHASSSHESEGIVKALGVSSSVVFSAIDLPIKDSGCMSTEMPQGNELKVVFLSRLTREKNLDGALRILQLVRQPLKFDIVGPKEDIHYWRECEALLVQLPRHVKARYLGPISPEAVFACLAKYDLLLLPTPGENYGHVIAESISVGTRVLISKGTPWRNLVEDGLGWDLDVEDHAEFAKVLDDLAQKSYDERIALRDSVRRSASIRLYSPDALQHNRILYS